MCRWPAAGGAGQQGGEGCLTKYLTEEAVKTGVSCLRAVGPFLGPGVSLAQAVTEEIQENLSWNTALLKLSEPRQKGA